MPFRCAASNKAPPCHPLIFENKINIGENFQQSALSRAVKPDKPPGLNYAPVQHNITSCCMICSNYVDLHCTCLQYFTQHFWNNFLSSLLGWPLLLWYWSQIVKLGRPVGPRFENSGCSVEVVWYTEFQAACAI